MGNACSKGFKRNPKKIVPILYGGDMRLIICFLSYEDTKKCRGKLLGRVYEIAFESKITDTVDFGPKWIS